MEERWELKPEPELEPEPAQEPESKQSRKTISQLGFCYVAGTFAMQLIQNTLVYVIYSLKPDLLQNLSVNLILSSVIIYGMALPLIILLSKDMPRCTIEKHKMKWWQFILAMIMCYSLVYISNFIGTMITTVVGVIKGSSVDNNLLDYVTESSTFLNFLIMVILAPIAEEYTFRKVIVDRTVHLGQGIAIAASGLMFGLFHGNLNQFAYAVVLGAFFAFIYIKTGNLKITIAMHAIINFMGGIISGQLFKLIDYQTFITLDISDMDAVLEYLGSGSNALGFVLLGLYVLFLFAVVIAGLVLIIVFFKRFKLESGCVPKGQRFKTLIVNPGMLFFCAIWIITIIIQLLI